MTDIREAMRAAAASNDLLAVDVPEWETKVYIRRLTVRDQKAIADESDPTESAMKVLMASLCDEQGNRLLEPEDYDLLLDQPFPVIMPLLGEAAKANGLTSKELEAAVAAFQSRSSGQTDTEDGTRPSP